MTSPLVLLPGNPLRDLTVARRPAGVMLHTGVVCLLLAGAGCARGENAESAAELTQHQRDSAIGASKLPGAYGVKRALGAADSAAARNSRLDSVTAEP